MFSFVVSLFFESIYFSGNDSHLNMAAVYFKKRKALFYSIDKTSAFIELLVRESASKPLTEVATMLLGNATKGGQ